MATGMPTWRNGYHHSPQVIRFYKLKKFLFRGYRSGDKTRTAELSGIVPDNSAV
jgi:hypothetical protein